MVTLAVSFQRDNQDIVSTWLLSCGLMCLDPLSFFKTRQKNGPSCKISPLKLVRYFNLHKLKETSVWPGVWTKQNRARAD